MSHDIETWAGRIVGLIIVFAIYAICFSKWIDWLWKRETKIKLEPEKPRKKFVAIDVSGSLREEMFGQIKNILCSMIQERITVILFDHEIVQIFEEFKAFDRLELVGRGGTDFTKLIEYVEKESKGKPCDLILFTDGFGEWKQPNSNIDIGVFYTDQQCEKIKGAKWEAMLV